jgi:transposase
MSKKHSTPSGGGGRNWPIYDAAQMNERRYFLHILYELCKEIEELCRVNGRRPLPLRDVVFCLVLKVYSTLSARRFQDQLREAQKEGWIQSALRPTSISEYMRSESSYVTLQQLLVKSSLPLSEVEDMFAVDSTGLSVPGRRVWFNKHTNRREKKRDHIKLHVMVGVKTKVITYAIVTEGTASDMNYLKYLVEGTSRYFDISRVSADAGYLSGENMYAVLLHGGIPYIAFKKNSALDGNYKSTFWKDMLYLWKTRHPVFTEHYFLRNNVEATFHAMKAKFGGHQRSRSKRGQFNEALAKGLCHNICVLINSMCKLDIDPLSWSEKTLRPRAEGRSLVEAMRHREKDLLEIRHAAGDRELPSQEKPPRRSRRAKTRKGSDRAPDQLALFD